MLNLKREKDQSKLTLNMNERHIIRGKNERKIICFFINIINKIFCLTFSTSLHYIVSVPISKQHTSKASQMTAKYGI